MGGVPKHARAGGARELRDALAKVNVVVVVTSAGGFVAPGVLRSAKVVVRALNVDPECAVCKDQARGPTRGVWDTWATVHVCTHTQFSMSMHSVLAGATQAFTDVPPADTEK